MKQKFLVISFDFAEEAPFYDFVLAVNEEHAAGMIQHLRGEYVCIVDVFSSSGWMSLSKTFIGMGAADVIADLRQRVALLKAECDVCHGVIRCSENGVLMCNCLEEDEWKQVEEAEAVEAADAAARGAEAMDESAYPDDTPYIMTDEELREFYWGKEDPA